jgi:hypothetical protein
MVRLSLVLLISWSGLPSSLYADSSQPSFLNDVIPVLTRSGCNQGSCHGKGAGLNGFRLSLRGYAPDQDYRWLTREFDGRRVDPVKPEKSLLLLKPIGLAPHEGGKLFDTDSRAYRVLLEWIQAGCPAPKKEDAKLTKLTLTPKNQLLKIGEEVQLLAIAEFSDGSNRDVTWLTKFDSNDAGLVRVTPEGKAIALRNGETAIRASFQTEVGVTIVTVPFTETIPPQKFQSKNNAVDIQVLNKLQALRIEPSELTTDEEFIRRVFLDTIGTLPTPQEVRSFLQDQSGDKRNKLIESLLNRSEFVDYWTLILCDLLQNRKERDHDVRGTKGVRSFHNWVRKQVEANRSWDQLVKEVLTSKGSTSESPSIGYFIVTVGEHREAEKSEVVASVAQAFLGTRIGCAQCHNHPLERYTQDDYYHFAGFFSRIKFERKESKMGETVLKVSHNDPKQNNNPIGVHQPRTGQFLKAQPLDRSSLTIDPKEDPREKLSSWMIDPSNEYFSGAMVNRIWKHYFGVGLVEPVDDLRATNPPTNPELWKLLKEEFVQSKYDLKHLMRLILKSRTYQLSSSTKPNNETDNRFYSHYYARRLPAEVMLDAISQCTGIPDTFRGYPVGIRTIQVPDPGLNSYFLTLFGRSERVTACACERMGDVTMPQLLHLQNGDGILNKIRSGEGRLTKWLRDIKENNQLMNELFLTTYSRLPTESESQAVQKLIQEGEPREEVFRDLFWALLNAKNFAFNH